jgi:hypothetical protein
VKTQVYKYNKEHWEGDTLIKEPAEITYTHYNTKRILHKVCTNQNDEAYISDRPVNEYQTGVYPEPRPIDQAFADQLDKLFKEGADILLETNQGWNDEGGDCYQAYIVLPEFTKHAWEYWDLNYERDGQCLWQICLMEYIMKFPANLRVVWAGAY